MTESFSRLLAVDPSLTASGWALFCLQKGEPLAVGVLAPPGPEMQLADRYTVLQLEVQQLYAELALGNGDVLIVEGPAPLVHNPNSALKVEGVRGIFETAARARRVAVPGRLNPRTVQTELLGMRGKQLPRKEVKLWARATAKQLFGTQLAVLRNGQDTNGELPQDIVDAVLIGTLAVSRVRVSAQVGQDLTLAFAAKGNHRRGRLIRR